MNLRHKRQAVLQSDPPSTSIHSSKSLLHERNYVHPIGLYSKCGTFTLLGSKPSAVYILSLSAALALPQSQRGAL